MNNTIIIGILSAICFILTASADDDIVQKIDISSLPRQGVKILEIYSGTPDKEGILGHFELSVPAFKRGCFFSDRKKFDSWHGGGNQIVPRIFKESYGELNSDKYAYRAVFIIFELEGGGYLAITPFSGSSTMSWIQAVDEDKLMLYFATLGTKPVSCDVPLFAWAKSEDVYSACREAWGEVIKCKLTAGRTNFRHTKHYAEPFKYLGWCSWEEYKKDISSDLLIDVVKKIEDSGLPIRYILVDDGHQQGISEDVRLKSFKPDPHKFPDGWKPFLDLRKRNKIKWMGLWHSFCGLQNTLHPENDFGALNDHLMKVTRPDGREGLVPRNNPEAAQAFYDALTSSVKSYGFDFMKIDYQMRDLEWYIGTDNAVEATVYNLQAMEEATKRDVYGVINCMAHNNVCIFNTKYSAVTRSSMDYKVGNAPKSKYHLWQSYHNTIWQCQTVWGDHDMFHSSDPYSGRMMAVSKAMSAAPVYMSDNPKDFIGEYIIPLSYEDGELLRPSAPACPLPESIFINPMEELVPYRVIASFKGGSAAIVVYNLHSMEEFDYWTKSTEKANIETTVKGYIHPADYQYASGMIQPFKGKWKIPREGLVAYDWYKGTGFKLEKKYDFELKGFSDKLFLISHIENGWAVIGRSDKYMSPAAVEIISNTGNELRIRMTEVGPLMVYCEKGKPKIEGINSIAVGADFYKFDFPVRSEIKTLTITR